MQFLTDLAQPLQQLQQQFDCSLPHLRSRLKETKQAISSLEGRLNFIASKQTEAAQRINRMNYRMLSIQKVKQNSRQHQLLKHDARRRQALQLQNKKEFNKLLKEHLRCNKEIVFSLYYQKIREKGNHTRVNSRVLENQITQNYRLIKNHNQAVVSQSKVQEERIRKNIDRYRRVKRIQALKSKELQEINRSKLSGTEKRLIQRLEQRESELLNKLSETQLFKDNMERELGLLKHRDS